MSEITTRMLRNGWSGRAAELKCGDCRATIDQNTSLMTEKWEAPSINWSAIGSVDADTAEQMIALMREAIKVAKQWDKKTGDPVKYPKAKA